MLGGTMNIEEARALTKQVTDKMNNDTMAFIFERVYKTIKNACLLGDCHCFIETKKMYLQDVSERLVKEGYTVVKYANGVQVSWAVP
jgi:hypothetical protein